MKRILTWLTTGAGAVLTALYLTTGNAHASVCSFSIAPIAFGDVDTLSATTPIDVTTTLSINCNSLLGVSICPSINAGSGGVSGGNHLLPRTGGGGQLQFRFFQDAARTVPWGSQFQTGLGTPPLIQLPSGPRTTTRPLYVRLFPGQSQTPTGTYQASFTGNQTAFVHGEVAIASCLITLLGATERPAINVTAAVRPNCLVGADNLDFGIQGVLNAQTLAQSALRIRCTPNTNYSIFLNNGAGGGTGPTDRRMTFQGRSIQYGLYLDAARSSPWGATPATRRQGTGNGLQTSYSVYGRVPPQNTPPAGTYTDTIVITVEY